MIERFNDSNKIVTNADLANDDRILTDVMYTYPGSVKAIHSGDLVQNIKNAYNNDNVVDQQKLLMGTEILVAVPRIVKIQCSMPNTAANRLYTHARVFNASLSITWPNGGTTTLPIPSTWVEGDRSGVIYVKFDVLTTAELCDGCQVKIVKSTSGGNAGVYVEVATDANGSDVPLLSNSSFVGELQTISSDMNAITLFTASGSGSGDIVINPKREITVELRSSGAAYYSVEITSRPSWTVGSQTDYISFGSSYSNVQSGQLLSTYTIRLDDGNYNVLFGSMRASVRQSPNVSASTIFVNPSPGNITITEGDVTAYKIVYDLGSPVLPV